jgi:hypothetical protein
MGNVVRYRTAAIVTDDVVTTGCNGASYRKTDSDRASRGYVDVDESIRGYDRPIGRNSKRLPSVTSTSAATIDRCAGCNLNRNTRAVVDVLISVVEVRAIDIIHTGERRRLASVSGGS